MDLISHLQTLVAEWIDNVETIGLKYWSAETGLYYKYKYQTGSVVHLWYGGQAACDDDTPAIEGMSFICLECKIFLTCCFLIVIITLEV